MDKLISIAQIRKRLREHGKIVPSAELVRYIITKYGYKPMANRNGYYKSAAATCLDMHIGEAIKYDQSKAEAIAKTNVMKPEKKEGSTYGRDYVRDGANNMQAYSKHLINKDNFGDEDMDESVKGKSIIITEEQYRKLFENSNEEGFQFTRNKTMTFVPGKDKMADTNVFGNDGDFKMTKQLLPKSGVMSYNLYDIRNMKVNKGLKHSVDMEGNPVTWQQWQTRDGEYADDEQRKANTSSIEWFLRRSVMYIRHIIGNKPVDIITYPQTSSDLNRKVTQMLLSKYPQSQGIKLYPELLIKNVRGLTVNISAAKSLGFTDEEIQALNGRIAKWKNDEDIRDLRRKIAQLEKETAEMLSATEHRKGRKPEKKINQNRSEIENYNQAITALRKNAKARGVDPTIDSKGNVKDWQIKSLDDRDRRAIGNLFILNPEYLKLRGKLQGKTIILFDDNISSGATLDEICVTLKEFGVKEIIPITLGTISPTIYKMSDRAARAN